MAKSDYWIGIDLGGTNIQVGVVTPDGKIIERDRTKSKAELGPDAVIDRIVKVVTKVCESADLKPTDCQGLGIGAPGIVDMSQGVVMEAVNLRWNDIELGKLLEKKLEIPVTVDNDVNVGTWGEYRVGAFAGAAEKGITSLLGVFSGTGVGGGLILNGQIYHGHFHTAGEIGHTVIKADGKLSRRTLENLASRTSAVNTLVQLIKSNHKSKLTELSEGDYDRIRSKLLSQAYADKDPLTRTIINHVAEYIGTSIANQVTMLSLPAVVVGGGLAEAIGKPFVSEVEKAFKNSVFPASFGERCQIKLSQLGDDAGLIGAALLAHDRID